jgi:hypothetical protein
MIVGWILPNACTSQDTSVEADQALQVNAQGLGAGSCNFEKLFTASALVVVETRRP